MELVMWLLISTVCLAVVLVGRWFFTPVWSSARGYSNSERTFVDASANDRRVSFPSVLDDASLYLSLVVPAYNEEDRLATMLDEALEHLYARSRNDKQFTWEIIIVDDGSRDRTPVIALDFCQKYGSDRIRLMKLAHNQGKGAAVRKGMMATRGRYALMVDADGATRFSDVDCLLSKMHQIERNGLGVAVGSRAHLESKAERTVMRRILQWGFHILILILYTFRLEDTQCGFKLFTRRVAQVCFPNQHIERWCFDPELLHLATTLKAPIVEVAVSWQEIAGTKMNIKGAINMFRDLIMIRLMYLVGLWRVRTPTMFM